MKDVAQVLRTKEEEIVRVKKELEALKIVAALLSEESRQQRIPATAANALI